MRRFRWYPAPTAHVAEDFEGDGSERLAGRFKAPSVADPDRPPFVYLYAFSLRRHAPKGCEGIRAVGDPSSIPEDDEGCAIFPEGQPFFWVKGSRWHAARLAFEPERHHPVLFRAGDCVKIERDIDSAPFYARVYHLRKRLLLLPLVLCAVLLALALRNCGTTSQAPAPRYMEGQKRVERAEPSRPKESVEYATYEATMDSEWRAKAIDQNFSLALPASSTRGATTGKNPVDSSPSIYVDINADGDFEPDECVYNAPDSSGYGHLLRAGSRVDSIELVRPLDAGTYSAMTVWRSVLAGSSTAAGETAFAWTLTVS